MNYAEMKAAREARELADNIAYAKKSDYTIDARGVVTWDSNGQVPPADMVAAIATFEDICIDSCAKVREEMNAAFIADYIKAQANRTEDQIREERFEARAAFGEGETVVNVFTGETYRT